MVAAVHPANELLHIVFFILFLYFIFYFSDEITVSAGASTTDKLATTTQASTRYANGPAHHIFHSIKNKPKVTKTALFLTKSPILNPLIAL